MVRLRNRVYFLADIEKKICPPHELTNRAMISEGNQPSYNVPELLTCRHCEISIFLSRQIHHDFYLYIESNYILTAILLS